MAHTSIAPKLSLASKTLGILLVSTLAACSSIENELYYQSENLEQSQNIGQAMGIAIEKEDYFKARNLWPWASGATLQRRAMIVSFKPPQRVYEILKKRLSERDELAILQVLIEHQKKPSRLSSR